MIFTIPIDYLLVDANTNTQDSTSMADDVGASALSICWYCSSSSDVYRRQLSRLHASSIPRASSRTGCSSACRLIRHQVPARGVCFSTRAPTRTVRLVPACAIRSPRACNRSLRRKQDFDDAFGTNRSGPLRLRGIHAVYIDHGRTLQRLAVGARVDYEVVRPDQTCRATVAGLRPRARVEHDVKGWRIRSESR